MIFITLHLAHDNSPLDFHADKIAMIRADSHDKGTYIEFVGGRSCSVVVRETREEIRELIKQAEMLDAKARWNFITTPPTYPTTWLPYQPFAPNALSVPEPETCKWKIIPHRSKLQKTYRTECGYVITPAQNIFRTVCICARKVEVSE